MPSVGEKIGGQIYFAASVTRIDFSDPLGDGQIFAFADEAADDARPAVSVPFLRIEMTFGVRVAPNS
jgi:hypothetical protein